MLMRYAQHLASGHGIVWNVGEQPVDGATDFLFVIAIAGLMRFGLSVFAATRLLVLISHALTVFLIYFAVRKLHGSSRWVAMFSAAYLALGTGFRYVEAYFGTPFFALAAAIAFWFAEECRREPESVRASVGFACASLVLGLIRPDGVFLAALMLLGLVVTTGFRKSWMVVLQWVATYAVLGGAYFLWHWHYFGNPLPNAYYVKGGGRLHLDGLRLSIDNAWQLCLPFVPIFLLGVFSSRRTRRETLFTLVPVAGFIVIWVLLTREMDYEMRFQYAILPLVLIAWPGVLAHAWEDWHLPRWHSLPVSTQHWAGALFTVASAGILGQQFLNHKNMAGGPDCDHDIALMLRDYQGSGYAMATTEPGILSLYSNWRVLDTGGLNDQALAHGAELDDRLDGYHPQIIVLHDCVTSYRPHVLMVRKLKNYMEHKSYNLAAAFELGPHDHYSYYVQTGFPDSDEIIKRIRARWESDPRGPRYGPRNEPWCDQPGVFCTN